MYAHLCVYCLARRCFYPSGELTDLEYTLSVRFVEAANYILYDLKELRPGVFEETEARGVRIEVIQSGTM